MAIKYRKKQNRHSVIAYTVITAVLLITAFTSMVGFFYNAAEDEAYETLHIQTKQIKDDLELQLVSDRENLQTMASFAAKLYRDGESYDLMFDSFEPIGLIANIGILLPDNSFVTKAGILNLNGSISFEEEVAKGEYTSGRVKDIVKENYDIVRSAVPIKYEENVVGILYGVIKLDTIYDKYSKMAEELDAQLFVFEKTTGNLIMDTIRDDPKNISFLQEREFSEGFSYENIINSDKGYSSFKSTYTGEQLYVHFSTINKFGWKIMLARYESQVFAKANTISNLLFVSFLFMLAIFALYIGFLLQSEKLRNLSTLSASKIRKLLLEINQQRSSILEALHEISEFSGSRFAMFYDTDGESYNFVRDSGNEKVIAGDDEKRFISELLRYAAELHNVNRATVNLMRINTNSHLIKTNSEFYSFLKKSDISEVSFASIIDKNNYISILGVVNPRRGSMARVLLEDVAVCFSIAIYNKKHLNKTEIAATTDALTGVANRVAYKKDLLFIDEDRPKEFSCIYVDVNELHLRNNKYGHAAGDEMLLYIANTLKEVFYGHKIYRMGGDEFLVFAQNTPHETIKKCITELHKLLELVDYHVAVGLSFRSQNMNTEEMVREAEVRMYESKAEYYQNKETKKTSDFGKQDFVHIKTGIQEIDAMISVLKENYNGIYRVSLDTDKARRILMPAYLAYGENEEHFSVLMSQYIDDSVAPEFHRAVISFLNYDALKRQISEGKTPKITYKKTNGDTVTLSVYRLGDDEKNASDTLWVFARG